MSDNIPFDIQEQIMKKLPIKSLVHFRCVSKAWKSLIDSVKFIADYDNVCRPPRLFISYSPPYSFYYRGIEAFNEFISILDDETFSRCNLTRETPYSHKSSKLVGSSHGLFCFYKPKRNKAFIWNPSIRKSIAIVVPRRYNIASDTAVGFGVCPLTLDPKIIMIPHYHYRKICLLKQVKVFSLSLRAWRRPSINLSLENMKLRKSHNVVIDGFIYWLASDDYFENGCLASKLIISFDLTSEEFREIHLPESIKSIKSRSFLKSLSISKLRETLVVLEYNKVPMSARELCAVWMMDNDSFTQIYTINAPATSLNTILGFRNNGAMIIEREIGKGNRFHQRSLAIYEPDSKQFTDIIEDIGQRFSFSVHSYVETLLLIDELDGIIYSTYMAREYDPLAL